MSQNKLKEQGKYHGGRCYFGFDIGKNNALIKCEKQQRELNLVFSLREKGTKYKDIKSHMEKYTGRKWFISFIHKLVKRNDESFIRSELKQTVMEKNTCDI